MSVNFELDELESRAKIIVEDFSGIFLHTTPFIYIR